MSVKGLMRRFLALSIIVAGYPCTQVTADIIVDFSSSNSEGTSTISGMFILDGDFSDTIGTGTIDFNVISFTELNINGVSQMTLFDSGPPIFPVAGNDTLTFSRDLQEVISLENNLLVGHEAPGLAFGNGQSLLQIALPPNVGTGLIDFEDFNPGTSFEPAQTTFLMLPEPREYAFTVVGLLVGVAIWHRKLRQSIAVDREA